MVFAWHFTHAGGYPVPLEYSPNAFPLAIFDEGHTGVALFMTLSGYLFAKLLDGKGQDEIQQAQSLLGDAKIDVNEYFATGKNAAAAFSV